MTLSAGEGPETPASSGSRSETDAISDVVVIGAGQAGGELALQLRRLGFAGRVLMVGDEHHPPYRRPALSKSFLTGTVAESTLVHASPARLAQAGIEVWTGCRAAAIDRATRRVHLSDGRAAPYGTLVLAIGGRPRVPGIPGVNQPGVLTLRTIGDARALSARFEPGRRLVAVGGGYVGLEVAATAVGQGLHATILEADTRILRRSTGAEIAGFLTHHHRRQGVDLRCGCAVTMIESGAAEGAAGKGEAGFILHCGNGDRIAADILLVAAGLVPNTDVAVAAGLRVDDGILIDAGTRTSDPRILAIGDCARQPDHPHAGGTRLESVQNALEQARIAAATICGRPVVRGDVPWFWSDQYDLRIQMVGLWNPSDRAVMRGDPDDGAFSVCHLRDGRLSAVHGVNRSADVIAAKRILASGARVDVDHLADPSRPLGSLVLG